ncbi:MAG TPA: hypothetical protein PLC61_06615 [Chitinophagales bacterium]|nr:hypothetical protein [Chitinophagales bacterium]HMU98349.1 hypothetical protein [Chitinophagales bacterium]HMV03245.1 hypothetical protein [Chitinophagales bacterium]HMW93269.1 hypothetical protein [Chitinophagales bacterium]HMY41996.1 hypothetical protein [Chitinophagales bacterium]
MKHLFIYLSLLITTICYGQHVSMNETLGIYEYSHIKEFKDGINTRLDLFAQKMKESNYSDVNITDKGIKGENFFTKMILGSAMEVHFNAFIDFKEGKYKLTINNFRIKDVRYGTVALETIGKNSQKKWVNFINEKLPQVVANLENTDKW